MGLGENSQFLKIWALGYHRLCSVVPPNAPLSENSSLWKRMQRDASKDSRGKVPGLRGRDGKWYGYNFVDHESTLADIERWGPTGASVGVKTGHGLYALDADTYDKASAKIIHDAIVRRFGDLPARIGQYPKALYLIRLSREMLYKRIEFGEAHHEGKLRGTLKDRLEVLAEGRQFVAHGIHPKTMEPYRWVPGMPAYADIPVVDPSEIDALLEELRGLLPAASPVHAEGGLGDSDVPQERLRGEIDEIRRAIKALPNTTQHFPERENWLHVGYAIKASLPDHEDEALDLFLEWSEKWEDGVSLDEDGHVVLGNDPDSVRAEWGRMQPPFRRGAPWLLELATKLSDGAYNAADRWLEEDSVSDDLFPPEPGTREAALASGESVSDEYKLVTIPNIVNMPDVEFVIDRHLPENSVGLLYGRFSSGKSFITLDKALSLAYGLPFWHGDEIFCREPVCVVYLAGEGAPGFKVRIQAWLKARGLEGDLTGRFVIIDQAINFMKPEDVAKVVRTLKRQTGCKVGMIVVDTVSRVIPGADENLQKDMTVFVAACDRLRDAFGCIVLGVHHTGKDGSFRGSSVLPGAGDFIFRLERKPGSPVGELVCEKQKDGVSDWSEHYAFGVVGLDPSSRGKPRSSVVIRRCSAAEAEAVGGTAGVAKDAVEAVLEALKAAWEGGTPWGMKANTGERGYVRRMVTDFGLTAEKASTIMKEWLAKGCVEEAIYDTKNKKKGIRFVKAMDAETGDEWTDTDSEAEETSGNSVFD